MIKNQEFDTPEEAALAHYGKKGMKWGVRNAPTTADIKTARGNAQVNYAKVQQKQAKVSAAPRGSAQKDRQKRELKEMKAAAFRNPDTATGLRLTNGEKAILGLLAVGVPGPGTVYSATFVASRVGARKSSERKLKKFNESQK